ncbi:hypothetical protein F5Y15DRAFT_40317 [Xylariaceae sp. FL0016]|nr:hypothetical protein F5Y15DRAFT_40317 [Xylariaceae sp. FL0016]
MTGTPLSTEQASNGHAPNLVDDPKAVLENKPDAEPSEGAKDQVDGAVATGPKKADASTGGRVNVAETGDLHDLAAKRQKEQEASK